MRRDVSFTVPAPVGTFVLHARIEKGDVLILQHVCTHFDICADGTILPRCMIAAGKEVMAAACLHPNGYVSGGTETPISFENVEQYRHVLRTRLPNKKTTAAVERARKLLEGEDLIG